MCGLLVVALYAYCCDRTESTFIFTSTSKKFETETAYIYVVLLLSFILTFRQSKSQIQSPDEAVSFNAICRMQTDEWKGWMQTSLLFYHYLFPAPQPLYIYIGARIMVASFLFMTGYGQTMKAIKADGQFQTIEFVLTLLRLNLLVVILCIVMGRSYGDYYFAPLVTFWSAFMYILHTTVLRKSPTIRLIVASLVCSCLSFNASRDPALPSFSRMLFDPISWLVSSRATPMDTWLFRLQLDCFSPLAGSIFACFSKPAASAASRALQASAVLSHSVTRGLLTAAFVLIGVSSVVASVGALGAWSTGRAQDCVAVCGDCKACAACRKAANASSAHLAGCVADRLAQEEYNLRYHPFLCILVTLTFLAARNSVGWLRRGASHAAAFVGRHSLELYLLQYHAWLAGDAKRILVLLPARPTPNAALLGVAFFAAAVAARSSTAAALAAAGRLMEAAAPCLARRAQTPQ